MTNERYWNSYLMLRAILWLVWFKITNVKAGDFFKMMKWMFWNFLSIAFPWLVLLIYDNPGGAFVALVMQATAIGWIPATLWAMRTIKEAEAKKK